MSCPICPNKFRRIDGDGPTPCDYLFIGERPGITELHGGRPFIGKSGAELNQNYLPLAGLHRDDIRLVNTVRCYAEQNRTPNDKEITGCAGYYMPSEVQQCNPQFIVLMGATACSLVPDIELEKEHGIPRSIESKDSEYLGGWEGTVIPMFHPAAGLHNTGLMIPLLEDFERLRKVVNGKYRAPKRKDLQTDYKLATPMEIRSHTFSLAAGTTCAIDTEDDCGRLCYIQYSITPGMGRLLKVEDGDALLELQRLLEVAPEVVFHNAPHDIGTLGQLGIKITKFRDTMAEAYHLGNLPQGLKSLAYRLLGIRMQSWADLVGPPSRALAIEWIREAWDWESDHRIRTEKQLKTKVKVEFKPTALEGDLKRILSHSHKPEYDIWEKMAEKGLESKYTPFPPRDIPQMSIVNAPLEEAIQYGCRDADVTLQVANWLEKERKRIVSNEWKVSEEDRDA